MLRSATPRSIKTEEIGGILESALQEKMELDSIKPTPSPICRPESDCWDLEIYFFYPERQVQTVRKVYRYTVDVSDAVPRRLAWFDRGIRVRDFGDWKSDVAPPRTDYTKGDPP